MNLTRFSLFFPEKREFFLENQGMFQFGGTTGGINATTDVPLLTVFLPKQFSSRSATAVSIESPAVPLMLT